MVRLSTQERQRRILQLARQQGQVEVLDVAGSLEVAPETIRRDLNQLARHGLIRRTRGGATAVESACFETGLDQRQVHHVESKRRIAAAAADFIGEAETVYIDEGYTHELLAAALPTDRSLTVLTTSLRTAATAAQNPRTTVLMLGGRVRDRTLASVGSWASSMLSGFVIDLAVMGANGISRERGLTTPDPHVAEVKAQAVKSAQRRILIGIHTKFGASTFCRFAEVSDFETIVTDTGLSAAEAHKYKLLGPDVHRV